MTLSSKAELRAAARQRRDALSASARHRYGQAILSRMLGIEPFQKARTVMAYSSFGSEFDTAAFLQAVLDSGKTLLLPRVNRAAGVLEIYRVDNLKNDLLHGVWGIREPNPAVCAAAAPADIDLILVPGLAFDRNGGRVGYGKGYYDKLLAQSPTAFKMAGAFEAQVFDSVPMEPHDVPIDALITEACTFHSDLRSGNRHPRSGSTRIPLKPR